MLPSDATIPKNIAPASLWRSPTWRRSSGQSSSSPARHIIWSLRRFEYGARVKSFSSEINDDLTGILMFEAITELVGAFQAAQLCARAYQVAPGPGVSPHPQVLLHDGPHGPSFDAKITSESPHCLEDCSPGTAPLVPPVLASL